MSGKSTLLRSIGLNAVLAWAGAPVRAESMRLGPVALGASLRTVDSLQEGRSRFYAEITRCAKLPISRKARARCYSCWTNSSVAPTPMTAASAPKES